MIVVLLGPPGSGKGTQAKKMVTERRWPQLSTGDMLRAAIQAGSNLGREAKGFMDRGELVPDSVVIGLIAERSQAADCKGGFVLDGFPRTLPQAEALNGLLAGRAQKIDRAVLFEIPDASLVRRLSGRRTCLKCGSMFHVESLRPKKAGICDQCGGELVQRADDQEEVILKRLAVYREQTAPLAAFYEKQGVLKRIDAAQPPQGVHDQLEKALGVTHMGGG